MFHVTIVHVGSEEPEKVQSFHKYYDAIEFINGEIAYWNNFDSEPGSFPFTISIKKQHDPNALGAYASETINAQDLLS